jgi:hypothetical protein
MSTPETTSSSKIGVAMTTASCPEGSFLQDLLLLRCRPRVACQHLGHGLQWIQVAIQVVCQTVRCDLDQRGVALQDQIERDLPQRIGADQGCYSAQQGDGQKRDERQLMLEAQPSRFSSVTHGLPPA